MSVRLGAWTLWAAFLALVLAPAFLHAKQVPALSLEEHVSMCPLIVVGSIDSIRGRGKSDLGGVQYEWKAELTIDSVLKGDMPSNPVKIDWAEYRLNEIPPYKPRTKMIWLLMQNSSDGSFYARRFDSTQPINRQIYIEDIIRINRESIILEIVLAKFHRVPGQQGIHVKNPISMPTPVTDYEILELEKMNINGIIEIAGTSAVGKGPKIRVILIMQKQVAAPAEFLLPEKGTLILVQSDQGWILEPKKYKASKKTIIIKSSAQENGTLIDYDIGSGRINSEAFSWAV